MCCSGTICQLQQFFPGDIRGLGSNHPSTQITEKVSPSKQRLPAGLVQDDLRIGRGGNPETNFKGKLALICPVTIFLSGLWVASIRWTPAARPLAAILATRLSNSFFSSFSAEDQICKLIENMNK